MPSFTYRKEDQEFELTEELATKLASTIIENRKEFIRRRKQQKEDAQVLIDQLDREAIKEIVYNKTVNTDDLFALKESFRANLRKYLDENIENFDTTGRDEQSDENKIKQKESLTYSIREMDFKTQGKELIDQFCIWGEFITYTEWVTNVKQVRRPADQLQGMIQELETKLAEGKELDQYEQQNYYSLLTASAQGKQFAIILQKTYEGVKIKAVDPDRFDYDVYNDFDSALKTEQMFAEYEQLLEEQSYKLDENAKEALKPRITESEKETTVKVDESVNDKETGQVELIQAIGDIRLADGTLLKNYFVVIANDKHVIRFEPNPYLINPYTIIATIKNYKTKRGVSVLSKAAVHVLISSYILTGMLDLLALVKEPVSFGKIPDSAKNKGRVVFTPGMNIEPDENTMPGQELKFLTHYAAAIDPSFAFLEKFKSMMQEVTGISNYMSGVEDDRDKAVGVANLEFNAQQIRLMMVIDDLQDFLLKNWAKLAELKSNYEFGESVIPINRETGFDSLKIDDTVRQGNYKYDYTDKRNYFERRQEADKFTLGVEKFKAMGAKVHTDELYKDWLRTWDKKDVEKYIMSDEFDQMIESLPPVIETPMGQIPKDAIKQQLAQTLNQLMTQLMQGGVNAGQVPGAYPEMPANPADVGNAGLAVA